MAKGKKEKKTEKKPAVKAAGEKTAKAPKKAAPVKKPRSKAAATKPAKIKTPARDGEERPRPVTAELETDAEGLEVPETLSGLAPDLAKAAEEEGAPGAAELEPELVEQVTALARAEPHQLEKVNLLQRYLAEVRRYPLVTVDEERTLAARYRDQGDREAARKLVTGNLRLVVKISLEYYRNWMDLLDLIQEGNVGLLQAVKKFDPYRGTRFSTYASFWIRAYILKFLMDNWRLVKIGTTQAQRKLFFNLKKERERLEQFGFKASHRLLADSLEVKESEVVEMDQRLGARDESLDAPISEDDHQTRAMVLADDSPPFDDLLADYEFARIVKKKLAEFRLTLGAPGREKEAMIFDRRLLAEDPLTLQDLGEKLELSRERVRQLETRLVKQLKDYLKQELPGFEDYEFLQT